MKSSRNDLDGNDLCLDGNKVNVGGACCEKKWHGSWVIVVYKVSCP
jgi:hypothetical protein